MSDPLYPESAAYHEAGHIVIAAVLGLRLSRHGIHLDREGRGISFYEYRKPKRFWNAPSTVRIDHTIIATVAGLIAQQTFHPNCSISGASDDNNIVDALLAEMNEEAGLLALASTTQLDLAEEAKRLVNIHWPAIETVARALWDTPETARDFREPEPQWSSLNVEKKLDGLNLLSILKPLGIHSSLYDAIPVAD